MSRAYHENHCNGSGDEGEAIIRVKVADEDRLRAYTIEHEEVALSFRAID